MQNKSFRKGLVVGIILLFVGLVIIPSLNAISVQKLIDKKDYEYDISENLIDLVWGRMLIRGRISNLEKYEYWIEFHAIKVIVSFWLILDFFPYFFFFRYKYENEDLSLDFYPDWYHGIVNENYIFLICDYGY